MLDITLAADLAGVIRPGCHLLLVGDINQLPSVGPGRVLRDLLAVPAIPRTRLTRVFRQNGDSAAIIAGAHRILYGHLPQPAPGVFGCNLTTERPGDLPALADAVVACVADRIPRAFDVTPADIQVLCPGKKNPAGMIDLNLRLQARLNPRAPDKPEHHCDGRIYRLGDRVLHIRNTPHRGQGGIFNGATGTITAVTPDEHHLTVSYPDGEDVLYPYTDAATELLHSNALTVHRSEGPLRDHPHHHRRRAPSTTQPPLHRRHPSDPRRPAHRPHHRRHPRPRQHPGSAPQHSPPHTPARPPLAPPPTNRYPAGATHLRLTATVGAASPGPSEETESEIESVAREYQRRFGPEYPIALAAQFLLARVRFGLGQIESAIDLIADVVARREAEHHFTVAGREELAVFRAER